MGTKNILFWTPRIVTILFAIFISLFATDVFNENLNLIDTIIAFLIHLIPTLIILFLLAIAWRWELVGAIIFSSIAIFYIFWTWGKFDWTVYVIITGPMFLISTLFLLNWIYHKKK